jgi:S1-C subfamily serine protease
MEVTPEKIEAEFLEELEKHKTPQCPTVSTLGQYIEQALPNRERDGVEKHLTACLYCLNQLVELRELLFLEKKADPLPADLEKRLQRLAGKQNVNGWQTLVRASESHAASVKNALLSLWNSVYGWQSAAALAIVAILVLYLEFVPRGSKESVVKAPITPSEPSVAVPPSSIPNQTLQAKTPELPKELLRTLSQIRIGADVPRIASTLQKLTKNLILESTRGERDIAVFQKAASAVVFVLAGKDSVGSGVIISRDGRVLTNWHVVGDDPKPVVVLKPKDSAELKKELAFLAAVIKVDEVADLALLKIANPPSSLSFLPLGTASSLNIGQDVHAIGHPQGEVWTYTRGIISQIRANYEWKTDEGITHRANIIQTQTPINPGNSGGPLLDDAARLVGINSFRRASGEGLNYAVSVDTINEFLSREGSREVARRQAPRASELKCKEGYDTLGRGWNDIIGCYQDSVAPPPDVWVVFRERTKFPAYVAMDSDTSGKSGKIDLVKKGSDLEWKATELYVDSDCDGTVDLIMSAKEGSDEPTGFRLPPPDLRMTALAKQLDTALKTGKLPYSRLKVCQ